MRPTAAPATRAVVFVGTPKPGGSPASLPEAGHPSWTLLNLPANPSPARPCAIGDLPSTKAPRARYARGTAHLRLRATCPDAAVIRPGLGLTSDRHHMAECVGLQGTAPPGIRVWLVRWRSAPLPWFQAIPAARRRAILHPLSRLCQSGVSCGDTTDPAGHHM